VVNSPRGGGCLWQRLFLREKVRLTYGFEADHQSADQLVPAPLCFRPPRMAWSPAEEATTRFSKITFVCAARFEAANKAGERAPYHTRRVGDTHVSSKGALLAQRFAAARRRLKSRFVRAPPFVSGSIRQVPEESVGGCLSLIKTEIIATTPSFSDRSKGGETVGRQTALPRLISQRCSTQTLKGLVISEE
jgi:hypothetical protein